MKVVVISGTPGTGKSTLAKALAKKLGYFRLDLHSHYKSISSGYDREGKAYVIDYKKFEKLVKQKITEHKHEAGLIIDSHIAHHLPKKMVDLCIVLTCSDLKELERRLKKRKYSKAKTRENLDCEIFQVCLGEARERGHKVIMVGGCKTISFSALKKLVNTRLM